MTDIFHTAFCRHENLRSCVELDEPTLRDTQHYHRQSSSCSLTLLQGLCQQYNNKTATEEPHMFRFGLGLKCERGLSLQSTDYTDTAKSCSALRYYSSLSPNVPAENSIETIRWFCWCLKLFFSGGIRQDKT